MVEAISLLPDEFESDLVSLLGAVVILAPFSFSFAGGSPINVDAAAVGPSWSGTGFAQPTDLTAEALLARAITSTLYNRAYAHRIGEVQMELESSPEEDAAFVRRFAEANAGRERWDPGWAIYHFGVNGRVFVRKGERERVAMPGAFISDTTPGMALQIGTQVRLHAPRESLDSQPSYYFAFGETLDELAEQLSLVRFYFHCGAETAVSLLAAITSALNRFQVPFRLKALNRAALYGRTDALVLYVGARYFCITARIVELVREKVALKPSVPLFTKRLWPGIGVAVEPGTGESFGLHRCRLVAEGIVDAWRDGKGDVPARLDAVAARFAGADLELAKPYLGPGGVDLFWLPMPVSLL
jgi:hypothetical protein